MQEIKQFKFILIKLTYQTKQDDKRKLEHKGDSITGKKGWGAL